MKAIKNFFFSKSAIIILIIVYAIIAFVSGVIEYWNGASIGAVLFLRGGTVIIDVLIIGLGVYAFTRKWLNKKFLEKEFFKKRLFWLAYIAETLAIFLLFYLPYVGRALYLLIDGEKIGITLSSHAFIINITLGFIFVLLLGARMKKILGKLEQRTKQNGFEKDSDSTTGPYLPLQFLLGIR